MGVKTELLLRKNALTDSFAAGLKQDLSAEEFQELLDIYKTEIAGHLSEWNRAMDAVSKPAIRPPKPELLPVTAPVEAREARILERREWAKQKKATWDVEFRYLKAIAEVGRKFQPSNNPQLTFSAAAYLWLQDVQTTPIAQLTDTAFFGIVGYWLRAKEAVNKRGYLFNSDKEEWIVLRELESRKDEWM